MGEPRRIDFLVTDEDLRNVGKCRWCPAPIVWWAHPRTKSNMPLDPATAIRTAEGVRLETHHAYCPHVKRLRKMKKQRRAAAQERKQP